MRTIFQVLSIILGFIIISCDDSMMTPTGNIPPNTTLFLDSILNRQNSRVHVSWSGDDQDGLVIGYAISWNEKDWFFTRKNDSTFALQVESSDTNFIFSVASIDNSLRDYPNEGDKIDFIDQNGNNRYDIGEIFPLLNGAIDPNPARLTFPIKNSPPIMAWGNDTSAQSAASVALPDTTFGFATFKFYVSDPDGDATLETIEWSLNDTSITAQWKPLAKGTRLFSVSAKDGLRLNADNVIYMRAKDIGKLSSRILSYPSAGKTWFVQASKGPILLIKDSGNRDADNFYLKALNSMNGGAFSGRFDILDINTTKTTDAPAKTIPPFISPMFIESLKLYSAIIWYTDKSPSMSLAQQSLSEYMRAGGKVLFIADLPTPLSEDMRTEIRDFSPIDSIGKQEVSSDPLAIRNGTEFLSIPHGALTYPNLTKERGSVLVYPLYPKANAKAVYRLPENPKWAGSPILGAIDDEASMVFLHLPLHLLNINDQAANLIETILRNEFSIQ
jgi:hypothetical protein